MTIDSEVSSTAPQSSALLTRQEAMGRLRVRSSHFSKLVAGKVRGLPPLPSISSEEDICSKKQV